MRVFNVGDVVRIKGQDIVMTVVRTPNDDYVQCLWYDTRNRLQYETFEIELLEKTLLAGRSK